MPPVRRAVGITVHTRGDRWNDGRADDRLVYSPYNTLAFTRQGSVPFAPFAAGGDTLVAAAVLTTRTAVWCSVGKYYDWPETLS